jgi:hypothetical protein
MTLARTGNGLVVPYRTGPTSSYGRSLSVGDVGGGGAAGIPLKYPLTPLAANAVFVVVTNTQIQVYNRSTDGLPVGSPITGSWTSGTGSATDAGLTPTATATDFVGIANAPAAGRRCWMYFNATQDVEWCLPGHPLNPQTKTQQPLDRPFGLFIQGGRHHRMLQPVVQFSQNYAVNYSGASGQNTPSGSGYFGQWNRAFYIKDWTGVWDIVGMSILPGNLYEAFNVTGGTSTNFRVQRSRVDGVVWYNPGGGHDGGDVWQFWHGPTGRSQFDHTTGISDYQWMFLAWNDSQPATRDQIPHGFDLSYCNGRTVHPSGAWLYYNTKGGLGDSTVPTTLNYVCVEDTANPTRSMNGQVGSLISTNGGITPNLAPDGSFADWTNVAGANTTGIIYRTAPGSILPGGVDVDYAPASKVGFGYDPSWVGWLPAGTVASLGYNLDGYNQDGYNQ